MVEVFLFYKKVHQAIAAKPTVTNPVNTTILWKTDISNQELKLRFVVLKANHVFTRVITTNEIENKYMFIHLVPFVCRQSTIICHPSSSITRRIETKFKKNKQNENCNPTNPHPSQEGLKHNNTAATGTSQTAYWPTSIIIRIETKETEWCLLHLCYLLTHIHYKKDWKRIP